ncbi:divergent polysaccharide deacetylase family protein [Shewanella sp. WXL01]|uniref:divergent polysaccharide deacetylase family protein n=1 Tax=Shewanella sp. WXL01 TaxID=2709721 RepID=UPI0032AEC339
MRLLLLTVTCLLTCFPAFAANLAIIIDDIGYRQTDKAVLSLDPSITLAVLPHTPLGKTLAQQGYNNGHEIMLHIPMQSLDGRKLGPGGLTNQMNERQIKQTVIDAVEDIPFAKGVNNHMGSFFTQLSTPMKWVMQSLKQKNLYFVDSVTTKFSKATAQAETAGVPLLYRQVFLDNDKRYSALDKQFRLAIDQAKQLGQVILIGHPYPETVSYLKKNMNLLTQNGVRLVSASSLYDANGEIVANVLDRNTKPNLIAEQVTTTQASTLE